MNFKKVTISLLFLLIAFNAVLAQAEKKKINAVRIDKPPVIDGSMDELVWQKAQSAKDFIQINPHNGKPATEQSEIKFLYDDMAVYVGAMFYDKNPEKILTYLGKRDEISNADYFGVYFDPFNDAITAYGFFVTASGVQIDMKSTEYEDSSWDAVWWSEVQITDEGWSVEMKIPYSALRFPASDQQVWGVNIFRNIMRKRENTSWNLIDQELSGINIQAGELHGINNVQPPLRLAFMPYLSSYVEKYSDDNHWGYSVKGGLDLKYGINESFTLDMMLIPDFGQVQSDDETLNLSPFETYYGEKRPFFMEGTELFNRAGILYSRRIGGRPSGADNIEDKLNANEELKHNPQETQLINATKITGKNPNGLGIGFINAMTAASFAEVEDTISGDTRNIRTQPFTNYNLVVFDKSLKNNSYISFINTNVSRFDDNYSANVTGSEFRLANTKNSYAISGSGAISQIGTDTADADVGHYYELVFEKTSGNFRFDYEHRVENHNYNPNDMGYLMNNNEFTNELEFEYNIYKPFWKFLNLHNQLYFRHSMLEKPRKYTDFRVRYNTWMTFVNNTSAGIHTNIWPVESHDYFEARVPDRLFVSPARGNFGAWFSTDYSKKIAMDINGGIWQDETHDMHGYWFNFSPRIKANDKLSFYYSYGTNMDKVVYGYISHNEAEDSVTFAKRQVRNLTNTLRVNYIFNNTQSLSFRLRHYWSRVENNSFYLLQEDGYLVDYPEYDENQDISFNAFTIDMAYTWNFTPGSELSIVWKNGIFTDSDKIVRSYKDNLENTWNSPQTNSISFKLLYYLDYLYLRRLF